MKTTTEIAKKFGVNNRTVRRWAQKGCPKQGRNRWCLRDVKNWRNGQRWEFLKEMPEELKFDLNDLAKMKVEL